MPSGAGIVTAVSPLPFRPPEISTRKPTMTDIAYAKVIADSISDYGDRLTTMEICFHRFELPSFNTHRAFSRNSASSRAIPVTKTLAKLFESPAFPISYPAEQPGMQGGVELEGDDLQEAQSLLADIARYTLDTIDYYVKSHPEAAHRLHKSVLNRPMEWFSSHTVIVSSTEWFNFFNQRCSPLAQPEIRVVAEMMQQVLWDSTPIHCPMGKWHLPYVDAAEQEQCLLRDINPLHVSVARCARVSYMTHDGVRDLQLDADMYQKLVTAQPPHASPLEHVATPANMPVLPDLPPTGNFTGWDQLRHMELGF